MSTESDDAGASVLTETDQRHLRQAMSAMPFSATSRVPLPYYSPVAGRSEPVTVASILAFLHGLRDVLTEHAARAEDQQRQLRDLHSDIAAFRRIVGIVAPAVATVAAPGTGEDVAP